MPTLWRKAIPLSSAGRHWIFRETNGMLILLAINKLFATAQLLTTGWKGGYIFSIMFAGIALGMTCEYLFPGVSLAVNVAAVALAQMS